MRHVDRITLTVVSSRKQILEFKYDAWLIINGSIKAVLAGDENTVYFPDIPYTRAEQREINEWHRSTVTHSRVMPADFDYYVAAAGIRGLRPLLTKPEENLDASV